MNSKEALKELEIATNWSSDEDIDKDLYNLWGNVACRTIKKDLERLEKLEKITDILKDKLSVYEKAHYRLSVNGSLEYQKLTKQEYEILKDWLENE